jgi:hypothetical protein
VGKPERQGIGKEALAGPGLGSVPVCWLSLVEVPGRGACEQLSETEVPAKATPSHPHSGA